MIGTADQVDAWVLLEYRPAWKARAVEENDLGDTTRAWLADNLAALAANNVKARPQLIRRPEIDRAEVELLVGVPGALIRFAGKGYEFLADVWLPDVLAAPERYPAVTEPRYFVCTNGQRDLCCARFGLPVYAALRTLVGDRVWQVTHLGGHRFAPNVLALPQGVLYGRVNEMAAPALVEQVEAGGLSFPHLRGRTWYPPVAQAAEAVSGRSDLTLVSAEDHEEHGVAHFQGPDGPASVRVQRTPPVDVLKSCGDDAPKPVRPFVAG
jgi:hypothetical protein